MPSTSISDLNTDLVSIGCNGLTICFIATDSSVENLPSGFTSPNRFYLWEYNSGGTSDAYDMFQIVMARGQNLPYIRSRTNNVWTVWREL